jgi:RHS repeat-associated protein
VGNNRSGNVLQDRLGSIGKFYPWGQEKPSATTNGTEKFTGYFRDSETTLDYAMNRYHQPGMGRFLTPDWYSGSIVSQAPGTWNRYAYASGDPVNLHDPTGLMSKAPDGTCGDDVIIDGIEYGCDGSYEGGGSGGNSNVCSAGQSFIEASGQCESDDDDDEEPPAPDCTQILTADITQYLGSYGGPLNTTANIQTLVQDGMQYDVDPRFIVALAIAESQGGKNLKWGPYNAWGIRARNPRYRGPGKKPPYKSWGQSIGAVNDLIAGGQYFGAGLTTTGTIYPVYQGPGYQVGLDNINTALGQMQGNQNLLTDPCNSKNLRSPNQ